jgi:hypothetical protein
MPSGLVAARDKPDADLAGAIGDKIEDAGIRRPSDAALSEAATYCAKWRLRFDMLATSPVLEGAFSDLSISRDGRNALACLSWSAKPDLRPDQRASINRTMMAAQAEGVVA